MSNIPISSLPVTISLTGAELVPIVQGGTTKRTTTGAISQLASTGTGAPATFICATDESSIFSNSRMLTAEAAVLSLIDGGAGSTIEVAVAANGIANAKLAQMATQTLKGNITGSTATPVDLTIAQVLGAAALPTVVTAPGTYNVPVGALTVIINKTDGADVQLPALALKVGPVTIIGQNADVHPFNVTVTDGTIVGLATYAFTGAWQSVTFAPYVAGSVWTL